MLGVLWGEMKLAERRIPIARDAPPHSDDTTWVADGVSGRRTPIRIAMLGDSTAAGYGVDRDRDTAGAQLAISVSGAARRPVHLTNVAVVGAESPDLGVQVDALARRPAGQWPEVALIMVGANDVVEGTRAVDAAGYLQQAVGRLHALGAEVVVCTCPDLGTIRPLAQPLRAWARHLSRRMAKEQTVAVVAAGGRTVSLGDLLGPLFADHLELFSADQFHPSAAGYAEAARAVLPSCLDALGLQTYASSASTFTTRRVKTARRAAAQAVVRPGTEVVAAERFGRAEGRRGPFARLRRRRSPATAVGVIESAVAVPDAPD